MVVSLPNSDGMNLFTPAFAAASMILFFSAKIIEPTDSTTASMLRKADSRKEGLKSPLITWMVGGKVIVEELRAMAETLKLALRRAWPMEGPRLPPAWDEVSGLDGGGEGRVYADDCDVLEGGGHGFG